MTPPIARNPTNLNRLLDARYRRLYFGPHAWADAVGMLQLFPGLVGLWTGSTPDASGNLIDKSGNGLTLTNNNSADFANDGNLLAPYVALASASSQSFTRADEAILDITGTEAHILAARNGCTFGGWFMSDTLGGTHALIGKNTATGNQRGYRIIKTSSDTIQVQVSSNGTATVTQATAGTVTLSTWFFAAGRFIPSTSLDVWLDGEQAANTSSIPASIFNNTAPLAIGQTDGGNFLNGRAALCFLCAAAVPDGHLFAFYELTRPLFNR